MDFTGRSMRGFVYVDEDGIGDAPAQVVPSTGNTPARQGGAVDASLRQDLF